MMNAHVNPQQVLNFKGRSLLAFVLEPVLPLDEWFAGLDAWLVRSPTFFAQKPVILAMSGLEIDLKDYRDLLGDAGAPPHPGDGGRESEPRAGRAAPAAGRFGRPDGERGGAHRGVRGGACRSGGAGEGSAPEPLFVDGNLRSGQSIMHPDGDVTIVGRVASGAEIVAGGSVHVYGALQGRVIAGISGSPRRASSAARRTPSSCASAAST